MPRAPKGWERIEGRRKRPVRTRASSSPPGKKRLRIKEFSKKRIVDMLLGWKGKLTWPLLMVDINKEFGGNWRYQSIAKHEDLQALFTATQKRTRAEGDKKAAGKLRKPVDATVTVLQNRIEFLERETEHQKAAIATLEARLNRWRANAVLNRFPVSKLDEPLQENDRGRSDRKR
jgi:hypothetical protein